MIEMTIDILRILFRKKSHPEISSQQVDIYGTTTMSFTTLNVRFTKTSTNNKFYVGITVSIIGRANLITKHCFITASHLRLSLFCV